MGMLPSLLKDFIALHPRIAVYGTGAMARRFASAFVLECGCEVPFLVDSFNEDTSSEPPVIRVADLQAQAERVDAVVMTTAFNKDILAASGDILRRFPLAFIDASGTSFQYTDEETLRGFLHMDIRTLGGWGKLKHGYEHEEKAKALVLRLQGHTMVTYDGLMTLTELVRYVDRAGVEGSLVECGSWRGGASAIMGAVHMETGPPVRSMHIFDSFMGLPEPDGKKDVIPDSMLPSIEKDTIFVGNLRPIGSLEANRASNEEAVFDIAGYPENLVTFHEGWFQDTVPGADINAIAVLRLDGDLYESYRVCLKYLYPLVTSGGIVIIDDWCLDGCRAAVREYFEAKGEFPLMHRIDTIARYLIKP